MEDQASPNRNCWIAADIVPKKNELAASRPMFNFAKIALAKEPYCLAGKLDGV
jgi:hypothetical protein